MTQSQHATRIRTSRMKAQFVFVHENSPILVRLKDEQMAHAIRLKISNVCVDKNISINCKPRLLFNALTTFVALSHCFQNPN